MRQAKETDVFRFSIRIATDLEVKSQVDRSSANSEVRSPKYDWINRIVAVGIGHRQADGPIYCVFEVL